MLDRCACVEKKVLDMHIPLALAKKMSLSSLSLVRLPNSCGPTTLFILSLTDALKFPITITSPLPLLITRSSSSLLAGPGQ